MPANVRVSASWKTVAAMHTRVGGSWKNVTEAYTRIGGAWKSVFTSVIPLTVNYLVIAGGGGGGANQGGGGGAGGYRTSAGTSGGGASAESALTLAVSTSYTVTVGGGGAGATVNTANAGTSGSNSVFGTITSTAGGGGGSGNANNALSGGSGGGGGAQTQFGSGAAGTTNQGFAGANATSSGGSYSGGGGGAGEAGSTDGLQQGGDGVSSTITGTAVTRAGGGGGGGYPGIGGGGVGGDGGGGAGSIGFPNAGTAGTANTGGGGGGGGSVPGVGNASGGAGGSGVVIIKYPSTYAINPGAGLSHRTVTSGGFNITTFTAGTGTVSFAAATTSSYELIQTVYLTASQSSVTFDISGISSDYQHLQIRAAAKNTAAVNYNVLEMVLRFNGSSANYRSHCLRGFSGSVTSFAPTLSTQMLVGQTVSSDSGTAATFGGSVIDILDPFETTKNKTVRSLSGAGDSRSTLGPTDQISLWSGAWFDTSAVTSITLYGAYGDGGTLSNFAANSRFSIYGLKGS